ncbi:MAG: hypothetical protein COZ66_00010 [Candidatus Huberarchaeum crystalense]|uniref:Uncharacterized protein n=1 Tax=Huberarchaeum crystalense TaxID=2014257 RepID=A0A2H9N4H5_HUBC1|nr:MAG: hypothetical protein COS45_01305 [Candidatus Huberarchaeum crystalense]PIX28322.1 MAG: hypothetical protein COZ66_00010 [Candidatus Huberarchaeum crystalense]
MKKIFFVLGIFVAVGALIIYGSALKNHGGEKIGDGIKIIEIKEKASSNENKEEMLKNLNANIRNNINLVPMMSKNKSVAISEIGLKPNIDVKIEKIVIKNKDMKAEKITLLNVSINEINKVKIN